MYERENGNFPRGKSSGRTTTTGAAVSAIFAVALLALLGLVPAGTAPDSTGVATSTHDADLVGIHAAATPATGFWVNRSQSSGTYINQYVSLNNSSTLQKIPFSICAAGCTTTVSLSATNCRWVTVLNLTSAANPSSIFHNVEYRNVTTANASGTVDAGTAVHAFKLCGGSVAWINYVYWSFSVYDFSAPTLGVNATVVFGGFSAVWPGSSAAGPANVSAKIGPKNVAQLIVSTNLTFSVVLPYQANGSTSCDITGNVCSYTQYSFASANDISNISKVLTLKFNAVTGFKVTNAYENWTVVYTNGSVQADTSTGAFFQASDVALTSVFVNWWYAWVLAFIIIGAASYVALDRRRKR